MQVYQVFPAAAAAQENQCEFRFKAVPKSHDYRHFTPPYAFVRGNCRQSLTSYLYPDLPFDDKCVWVVLKQDYP